MDFNKPHILLPVIAAMVLSMAATVFALHESSNNPLPEPEPLEKHHCVEINENREPTRYSCFFTEKEAVDLIRTCALEKWTICEQIYRGWFVRHENGLLLTSNTIHAIEKSFGKIYPDSNSVEKRYCVDAAHYKLGIQPCQDSNSVEKRYCVEKSFTAYIISSECFSTKKEASDASYICNKESAPGVGCRLRYNESPNTPLPDSKPLEKHHCVRVVERGEPTRHSCFFTEIEATNFMSTCPPHGGDTVCYQRYKGHYMVDEEGCIISTMPLVLCPVK